VIAREVAVHVIGLVGVGEFEVEEIHLGRGEERPGMPGAAMELDADRPGDAEGADRSWIGHRRAIVRRERRRHRQQPLPAAHRREALRDPDMARDPVEGEAALLEAHDVEARGAVVQDELRVGGAERGAVLAGRDDLAEGGEGVGRNLRKRQRNLLGHREISSIVYSNVSSLLR
jgi:hypothetical protein